MIALDKTHTKVKKKQVRSLKDLRLEKAYLRGTGGGDAGRIWNAAMKSALRDLPRTKFKTPTSEILRGVKVYEEFVDGAKEGFDVALRIIPYLVAILVAIGMFRAAGIRMDG